MFSWVSFPKTGLQTDTARCLSRSSRKAPRQPRSTETAGRSGWSSCHLCLQPVCHGVDPCKAAGGTNEHVDGVGRKYWGRACPLGDTAWSISVMWDSLEEKKPNKCYVIWLYYLLLILSIPNFVFYSLDCTRNRYVSYR